MKTFITPYRYWVPVTEVESQTQGSRPRTQKKSGAKAKDSSGQTLSKPRTRMLVAMAKDQAQVLSKSKKNGLHKNFSGGLQKKTFSKNFSEVPQTFNNSKK